MPYDSAGAFTNVSGYLATTGDTATAAQHNEPLEDIATALGEVVLRDGRAPMTGNLKMGDNKITGLADGADDTDAATAGQIAALSGRLGAATGKLITDWNDATDFGLYYASSEDNAPPDAMIRGDHTGGGFNFGIAIPYASTYLVQIVTAASWGPGTDADTQFAMRSCRNGTWTDWFKLRWSETEQAALWAALTDLASTASGKGASLVGVQDSAANFSGTTVEAVLAELYGLLLGVGQTWQDVKASRTGGTSYQNTTGRPIEVAVTGRNTADGEIAAQVSSDGSTWITVGTFPGSGSQTNGIAFTVPDDWYYRVSAAMRSGYTWSELS